MNTTSLYATDDVTGSGLERGCLIRFKSEVSHLCIPRHCMLLMTLPSHLSSYAVLPRTRALWLIRFGFYVCFTLSLIPQTDPSSVGEVCLRGSYCAMFEQNEAWSGIWWTFSMVEQSKVHSFKCLTVKEGGVVRPVTQGT